MNLSTQKGGDKFAVSQSKGLMKSPTHETLGVRLDIPDMQSSPQSKAELRSASKLAQNLALSGNGTTKNAIDKKRHKRIRPIIKLRDDGEYETIDTCA